MKVMNFILNYSSRVPTNQEGRRILRKETNLLLDLLGSPERYRRVGANRAGANGTRVNGARVEEGLPRLGGC